MNSVLKQDAKRYPRGGGYQDFRFGTEERKKLKIL